MTEILLRLYLLVLRVISYTVQNLIYLFMFPLIPISEPVVNHFMKRVDVRINGNRPWDIKVLDRRLYARIVAFTDLGLGESYVEGWWMCEDLYGCLYRLSDLLKVDWIRFLSNWSPGQILHELKWNFFNVFTREMSLIPCNLQYNLTTDYFHTITDTLCHSMAYFSSGAKTEGHAQFENMRQISCKLGLKPGMKVLDMGCGFGTLAKYMADNFDVQVVGLTNSTGMGQEAQERCQGSNVLISICDWRDFQGSFDRIVCIEMSEHVGRLNYPKFYRKLDKMLKPGGRLLVQVYTSFGIMRSAELLSKYLYGGLYFPTLEFIVEQSEKYLDLVDLHDMTYDAVQTCLSVVNNIGKAKEKMTKEFGKEVTKTMYLVYAITAAFLSKRRSRSHQLIFVKKSEQGILHFPRLMEDSKQPLNFYVP